MSRHIAIIGNGIAGVSCARHLRKRDPDVRISLISGETEHFWSRTALMYIYMGHMKYEHTKPYEDWFWAENRIELLFGWVSKVDTERKSLKFTDGRELPYDELVLATGSSPNKFGWSGQELPGVQGMYSLQDLERMERDTVGIDHAVVVGGGLIGIEMAEMLASRGIGVSFLVREQSYWQQVLPKEESEMVGRHIREHHIDLRLGEELDEIEAGPDGRAAAVRLKSGERIECGFVGLCVGVHPNIAFLQESGIGLDKGIVVDRQFRTNIHGVFAIGDCAQFSDPPPGRRALEQVWYTGRMQGETLAAVLCGEDLQYNPGHWFNSAKFFDIEYQVYGQIQAAAAANSGTDSIYWEHPEGRASIRIEYEKSSGRLLGINLMGVRYRHHVCDQWLRTGAHVETVLQELGAANFDPEFYPQHEAELVNIYNKKTGSNLQLKRRRGWRAALELLKQTYA